MTASMTATTVANGSNGTTTTTSSSPPSTSSKSTHPSPAYANTIYSLIHVLRGLSSFLAALPQPPTSDEEDIYTRPFPSLGATIGAHTRHILDRLQNVLNPVLSPSLLSSDPLSSAAIIPIDYSNRNRNSAEQSSRSAALSALAHLESQLLSLLAASAPSPNTFLSSKDEHDSSSMITTLWNELAQGRSHTIHHCAYLRVVVESEFGVWEDVARGMGEYRERFGLDSATPKGILNGVVNGGENGNA